MPLPAWLARLNRRVTNPALRPLAKRVSFFGVVVHRGRTSDRVYRTPVNVFADGDHFVIALTYGREVDWVENVIAAGGCRLSHRGRIIDLADPRLVQLSDTPAVPGWIRAILRSLGVDQALQLRSASGAVSDQSLGEDRYRRMRIRGPRGPSRPSR